MSWDPVASLNFPVETSTASFLRCSGILLAGSERGKSEGIELSMGSTVTIKDMTTLEEFILINTLHQCRNVYEPPLATSSTISQLHFMCRNSVTVNY